MEESVEYGNERGLSGVCDRIGDQGGYINGNDVGDDSDVTAVVGDLTEA